MKFIIAFNMLFLASGVGMAQPKYFTKTGKISFFSKSPIENSKAISLNRDNSSTVKVNGALTMHGITKPVNTTAVIMVKSGASALTVTLTSLCLITG